MSMKEKMDQIRAENGLPPLPNTEKPYRIEDVLMLLLKNKQREEEEFREQRAQEQLNLLRSMAQVRLAQPMPSAIVDEPPKKEDYVETEWDLL